MDNSHRYQKGGSAGSKGVQFQVSLLTVFVLNALKRLNQWKLSTENKQAGKFDDVVLETPNGTVLLQAKFRENNEKTITLKELMSNGSGKDHFSLPKYYFSYQEVKTKYPIESVIICTNAELKLGDNYLREEVVEYKSMLYYEEGIFYYKFKHEFIKELKTEITKYYKNKLSNTKATISDESVSEFLDRLEFHSNYPSQRKLNEIIQGLFSGLDCAKNLWPKTCSNYVYFKIMDWFQQRVGLFFTETRAKALFCEIRSNKYCETLEKFDLCFERNNYNFDSEDKMYHIIAPENNLIDVIKVHHSLQKSHKTENLFVNPEYDLHVMKNFIEAFELPLYCALVIIWPNFSEEQETNIICQRIKNIMHAHHHKKVILIGDINNKFAQKLSVSCNSCIMIQRSIAFGDFSLNTQEKLLKKQNIVFQGKFTNLRSLISNYRDIVGAELLEKSIRDEKIKVGSEIRPLTEDVARYYIKRKLKKEPGSETFPEDNAFELQGNVILLSDSAGMGKSTVLTKLAMTIKSKYPHLWIIRIELNDYSKILKEYVNKNKSSITIMELLMSKNFTKLTNHLEERIFSLENKVVLMLDGVDEVSPTYTELVSSVLIESIAAKNFIKVFVTTRPHVSHILSTILRVEPFNLEPFTEENQRDFLTNYWMYNLEINENCKSRCEYYANELIKKMSTWISFNQTTKDNFAAIPLQIRMMAEIFQENTKFGEIVDWKGCKEYVNSSSEDPKLPDKMDITRLYEMFIEKKRGIFLEKGNPSGNTAANDALIEQFEAYLAYHRILALDVIFDKTKCELFSCYSQRTKNVKANMLRIGIVQKIDEGFHFVHRTFAEYFVAECILEELQKGNAKFLEFFITNILLQSELNVIRAFLDSFLEKIGDTLSPIAFESYESIQGSIDSGTQYLQIHRLGHEGCVAILKFLLKSMDFKPVIDEELDMSEDHDIFKTRNAFRILQHLVQEAGVNLKEAQSKTPLHYAMEKGHLNMATFLIDNGANMEIKSEIGLTALQYALDSGHLEMVKLLVQKGADPMSKDYDNNIPLIRAILHDRKSITCFLLDITSLDDSTAAYAASYLDRKDLLDDLFERGVDANCSIENGETLIFAAGRGESWNILRHLIDQGADINKKREDGCTPLHFFTKQAKVATIVFLIENGADVNVEDSYGKTAVALAEKGNLLMYFQNKIRTT